jgi:hypothetical protein
MCPPGSVSEVRCVKADRERPGYGNRGPDPTPRRSVVDNAKPARYLWTRPSRPPSLPVRP